MHAASFIAIGTATLGLLALSLTSASAGDYDSGYNSGDTDTVTISSDPYTGGATQEDYDQTRSRKGSRTSSRATMPRRMVFRLTIPPRPTIPPDIHLQRRRIRAPSLS